VERDEKSKPEDVVADMAKLTEAQELSDTELQDVTGGASHPADPHGLP
jgi:bacteriocin-like protein